MLVAAYRKPPVNLAPVPGCDTEICLHVYLGGFFLHPMRAETGGENQPMTE
jgi:hypothetical protein